MPKIRCCQRRALENPRLDPRMNAPPIQPLEQCRELGGRQPHRTVLHFGPVELAILETFRHKAYPAATPEDQLDLVRALGPEHIDRAGERVGTISGLTSAARPSAPLRKSTDWVATMTFTVPDGPITAVH